MSKVIFENNQFYHIYNRGVDKREVFIEGFYYKRFLTSMKEFNRTDPIGSLLEKEEREREESARVSNSPGNKEFQVNGDTLRELDSKLPPITPLVQIISYCLNPNHYHLVLQQLEDNGISKYMHKLGLGYTNFFNTKNKRNGALFQGRYKTVEITSDDHLLWAVAYVNGNAYVHGIIDDASKYGWCSYPEYLGLVDNDVCNKKLILDKFNSLEDFKENSEKCFDVMRKKKEDSEHGIKFV